MEQPDLNYLNTVIRSILTSSPDKVTISQILNDYSNFEGCNLSFEHLGFKTIYELLESMTDVLRIPHNPNMNSFVTLIVDEKTSHLRKLVKNQKTKTQRNKRNISALRSSNNHLMNSTNYNSRVNNLGDQRNEYTISTTYEYNTPRYENSTPKYDTNARGYDHVKIKSVNSKPNSTVTTNLRGSVENLCNTSEVFNISTMEQPDLNYLNTVIRSILTSSPDKVTISQILNDYSNFEGCNLSFEHLGFKTIYELLESMTDVLRIPHNPNMNSFVTLIVDEKTSHLRKLVKNQKTKTQRNKRNISALRSSNNHLMNSTNYNSRVNNLGDQRNEYTISTTYEYNTPRYENSTPKYDTNARGYDHVKIKSVNSKPNSTVTTNLRGSVENLCNTSEVFNISTMEQPDLNYLNTVIRSILTSSPDKVTISQILNDYSNFEGCNLSFEHLGFKTIYELLESMTDVLRIPHNPNMNSFVTLIVDEKTSHLRKLVKNQKTKTQRNKRNISALRSSNNHLMNSTNYNSRVNNLGDQRNEYTISTTYEYNTPRYENSTPKYDTNARGYDHVKIKSVNSKPNSTVTTNLRGSVENLCNTSEIMSIKECEENSDMKNYLLTQKDDYKSAIVAIISRSNESITVNKVLIMFQEEYGYTFPFQKFFCRSYMDFFRLYPHIFKLEDQCSTNSVVSLKKQIILEPKSSIRKQFNKASMFGNVAVTDSENKILNGSKIISELISNESSDQINKYPLVDNSCHSHSVKSIDSYEMHDSDRVSDTMKAKMHRLLSKHKDGILSNDFINVFHNEYNIHIDFSKYGFRSIGDMAYKLPSIFYVNVTDDENNCVLFEADRRSELKDILEDPSLYYKNLPKTILYNLSHFFNKYRNGVKFNVLMSLYCAEYGRAYEPLKYGYSSERHMFESLDKMVEIENNELFTKDPFAYTKCLKNKNVDIISQDNSSIVLVADDFLLRYTGKDICNGKFRYSNIKLNDQKVAKVVVSEVYNPSSFYVQLEAEVNNLNEFMDRLQEYYEKNEEKYKVTPRLILPELPCASCYEDSNVWHRAMVLSIVDEENVKLLYVDYGTIKVVSKTNVRLLASQFGSYLTQAVYCGLYNFNELNYPLEINESFAEIIDDHVLEAQFHSPNSEDDPQKMIVTLFLNTEHDIININKKCSNEIINQYNTNPESIGRMIFRVLQGKQWD